MQPYIKEQDIRALIQKTFNFIKNAMEYSKPVTEATKTGFTAENTEKQ